MDVELNMFSLNALKEMEIIDVNLGKVLGTIYDLKLDCDNFNIVSLLIIKEKPKIFGTVDFIEIPWEKIQKIGYDVILVDCDDKTLFEA
ncbi:YlmC/YmxH family sporulation protein [Inconstantimicrobium mannanitabidum]|uniref:Uncharacterized protein n=1 Tax=Inconstantimicrobium mannanitabidum TaxID=1604901 RepID=A0ACB5RCX4_9CLOT|nr:YlmC/YmxH family sporulation protein [Clostridium sp. TW13]GKX66601.1 hypothetical protein rsdtw13_18590 [Clostridium sp. TW13]